MQCGRVLCVSVVCVGVAWSVGMVVVWSAVLRDSSVFNMMRSGFFFIIFFFSSGFLVSFNGNQPDSHDNEMLRKAAC